jgi:hypothetical protein
MTSGSVSCSFINDIIYSLLSTGWFQERIRECFNKLTLHVYIVWHCEQINYIYTGNLTFATPFSTSINLRFWMLCINIILKQIESLAHYNLYKVAKVSVHLLLGAYCILIKLTFPCWSCLSYSIIFSIKIL